MESNFESEQRENEEMVEARGEALDEGDRHNIVSSLVAGINVEQFEAGGSSIGD